MIWMVNLKDMYMYTEGQHSMNGCGDIQQRDQLSTDMIIGLYDWL